MNITKINDNYYNINDNLNYTLKDIYIPFKISKYNNNYYLNIEINIEDTDNINKKFINEFSNIEKFINNNDLDFKNNDFYSNLKIKEFNNKKYYLFRLQLKKNKNKIITTYQKENEMLNIFKLENKKYYSCNIEISGIWKYKNTYGLQININTIY